MAVVVDRLEYIIGIDTKGLKRNVKDADRAVQSMSNNIKKALGAVGVAFIAAFGLHQMKRLADSLGDFAFKVTLTAARTEVLDVVLKRVGMTAGHSFAYLKRLEGEIKDLGITTQVSRLILIRLMQTNLDLSYATKIATAAQNLAIIAGQNTAQAAETLTRAVAAQRPILLKQFGIMTNLNDIYAKQAKLLNKSVDELTEIERRQAFVNEIMIQAARVQGIYTDAMEKAGKKYTSIPRHAEEAANAIGNIFLPVFGQMVDDVTQGFKDIKAAAEDETAVKKWQEDLLLLYQPVRLSFLGIEEAIGLAAYGVRILKFELLDLPLALAGVTKAIEEATKPFIYTGPEQFIGPLPKPEVVIAQLKELSDAELEQQMWRLDLERRYNKISLDEYCQRLKGMIAAYQLTAQQETAIRRKVAETEYAIDKQRQANFESRLADWNETYKSWLEKRTQDAQTIEENRHVWMYEQGEIELEEYVAYLNRRLAEYERFSSEWMLIFGQIQDIKKEEREAEKEEWEKTHAFQLSIYKSVGNAAARTFSDIFTSGKSLSDALKDGWKSFMDSVVNILADMLARFIYTSLAELVRHWATEKAKTAITKKEAAKRAAMSGASVSTFGIIGGIASMFLNKGGLVGMQGGGLVRGLQTTRDNILAALSAGEFVIPRPAVQRIGVPALEQMRRTGETPSRNITLNIGDVTIAGKGEPSDLFLIEEFKDSVVEAVEEGIRLGELEL